jgi:hypothetical protein
VVSLTFDGIDPRAKKFLTVLITSIFKVARFLWKNLAGKPSGPGAFRGPIWNCIIYFIVGEFHQQSLIIHFLGHFWLDDV